jgi:hypothetical protein
MPAHGRGGVRATIEFNNSLSAKRLWCLLDDVRTFFEQNPEDFAD